MSETTDDIINQMLDRHWDNDTWSPNGPRIKTCRRCQVGDLYWQHTAEGWRLHHWATVELMAGPRFVIHRCGYHPNGTKIGIS